VKENLKFMARIKGLSAA